MIINTLKCKNYPVKSCAASVLDDLELELMSNNVSEALFERGESLFRENILNGHVTYIQSGLVKIHMKADGGKDYIIKLVKAPAYLGLATIFGDRINNYSATALVPTTACFIDIDTFKSLIHKNGGFAYEIIADISRNELLDYKRFAIQSHKQTPGRIAGVILYFAEKVYQNDCFELPLSRNEIAELIGISRESVTRALMTFKKDGIIDIEKHRVHIRKMESLQAIDRSG